MKPIIVEKGEEVISYWWTPKEGYGYSVKRNGEIVNIVRGHDKPRQLTFDVFV